ncbi:hypothetical protein ACFL6S_00300 [Candidatus Poribacteria bacterium]
MLILKRVERNMVQEVCLCSLVIFVLLINVDIAAGIDVAICTVAHPWPQATADQEIPIMTDLIKAAVDVQSFGDGDLTALADWVVAHTSSENNVLILTGILPTTLYAAGNAEPDGSIVEEFLDAGNTIINTGEYTFYTIEGPDERNEDMALPNILDAPDASVWHGAEGWRDGAVTMTPTADGAKYTPSIVEYGTSYPIHVEDYDGTPWELEIAVAENTAENLRVDGMIVNTETGGRLGIFVQAYVLDIPAPDISWGAVIGEFVVNYYLSEVAAVEADGKLTITWGSIKER